MKSTLIIILCLFFSGQLFSQNTATTDSTTVKKEGIIQKVENWYADNMNYGTITALMTIESSFIPFPSEVVIPPAAYIASQEKSHLNIFLVVVFGTIGSILGALINYFLALYLGRVVIYKLADSKLGRMCLLSSEKVEKAEKYFNENGNTSTFVGRLIPGIRQLISLPAGLAKMKLYSFILYTTLGALIWNSILAAVGYIAHGQKGMIDKYNNELSIILMCAAVLFVAYIIYNGMRKAKKKKELENK